MLVKGFCKSTRFFAAASAIGLQKYEARRSYPAIHRISERYFCASATELLLWDVSFWQKHYFSSRFNGFHPQTTLHNLFTAMNVRQTSYRLQAFGKHLPPALLLAILLMALTAPFAHAQKNTSASFKKTFKDAEEYIRIKEYHFAFEMLQEIFPADSLNPELNYYLGVCYLNLDTEDKKKALPHLQIAEKKNPPFQFINYLMGRSYHLNHQWDIAISYYEKQLKDLSAAKKDQRSSTSIIEDVIDKKELNRMIGQCRYGKAFMENPASVEIFNLGAKVNTAAPEISPVISADEQTIIFTSRRENSVGGGIDPLSNLPFEDIYIATRGEDGEWQKAENIGAPVNTDSHDASIGLSPDGLELFVYKGKSATKGLSGDIYKSYQRDGKWSAPESLGDAINSSGWETHATVTADDRALFFVSNRKEENSQGGKDIYMIRRLPNGQYAQPFNLGAVINTDMNEDAPFIHPNGKVLYFASEGHDSMGGYDIFYSRLDPKTGEWGPPTNMGWPINSADDDVFYSVSADDQRGYFSSIRDDSFGSYDLYVANVPGKELQLIVMRGRVTDAETGEPLAAVIQVVDNDTQQDVTLATSNAMNGRYSLYLEPGRNYGVRVLKENYLFKSFNVNIAEQFEYIEIVRDAPLQKIKHLSLEVLHNVFFTSENEVVISSDPELKEVQRIIDDYPQYIIEVAVHSDNLEDSLVSLFYTQGRADALVNRLTEMGVNSERLVAKGYGFGYNYPIASNETTQGRLQNNRIEYVLRRIEDKDKDLNYADLRPDLFKPDQKKEFECPPLYSILTQIVRFNTIDNELDDAAIAAIDEIAEILDRCPDIALEIGGHTDNTGTDRYALEVAEKRARLVAQQIAYRGGIGRDRLVIKSFAAFLPIADNDTEDGKAANRRVEFKVLPIEAANVTERLHEKVELTADAARKLVTEKEDDESSKKVKEFIFYFDLNSDQIADSARVALASIAEYLELNPNKMVEVAGYTDDTGSAEFNLKLGKRRAETVAKYVFNKVAITDQVRVISYGESNPIADNSTETGRQRNRRVELRIFNQPKKK